MTLLLKLLLIKEMALMTLAIGDFINASHSLVVLYQDISYHQFQT
jgi:hypothetical protein